jgi:tripartite-type tricarboxylate transporter receptor subunit TctC
MTVTRRKTLKLLAQGSVLAATTPLALPALAQTGWPTRPVRMIVPFAVGGATGLVGRLVADGLSRMWGQQVIVEARTGAGGNVGGDVVVRSPPDGYTLLIASGSITINPSLYGERMPFQPLRDLAPISIVAEGPKIVVVKDDSPYRTLRDLISAAKAQPGKLTFGSAGIGSQVHLAVENLAYAAGIDVQHVPYRGEAAVYPDIVGGHVDFAVGFIAGAGPLVAPGRMRALAVTSAQRVPQYPDLPTASEAGLPGFTNVGWFGLLAPAGTPQAIVDKIERDVIQVLKDTQIRARLFVMGMNAVGSTQAQFRRTIEEELVRWAQVVKARNLAVN